VSSQVEIFERLNEVNDEIQWKNRTMVDIGEKISSFKQRLTFWWETTLARRKIATFSLLSEFLKVSSKFTLNSIFKNTWKNYSLNSTGT